MAAMVTPRNRSSDSSRPGLETAPWDTAAGLVETLACMAFQDRARPTAAAWLSSVLLAQPGGDPRCQLGSHYPRHLPFREFRDYHCFSTEGGPHAKASICGLVDHKR